MLRIWDLSGPNWLQFQHAGMKVPRSETDVQSVLPVVEQIISSVKSGDEKTILDLTAKLDGVRPQQLRVPEAIIQKAINQVSSDFRHALEVSAERVRQVSKQQLRQEIDIDLIPGGKVTSRWIAVDRVGLYVPGGRAAYPSSVVMNVVPAQVAGVQSLMVMSPPSRENDGWPAPPILAAAGLLGINEIYSVGGAQAIAMATFGIGCHPVNLITGPGNIYVTAAKRALSGQVGIDSEAGPTEVMIIADETANPRFVAADLISQAEHDVVAAAILVTTSKDLFSKVNIELAKQVARTKHSERIKTALSGIQSMAILVDDVDKAVVVANSYGAEHLEIQTKSAHEVANQIRNAGAVFIGDYTPVSLGDYLAGSNHVLPTGGCACHSSGLSVETFLKLVNLVEYSHEGLAQSADGVRVLALSEDLPAHWEAINSRFSKEN
jgi:histidinol dehydrogenase